LAQAKLFIKFLGEDTTLILDSSKSKQFVRTLKMMNESNQNLVKIDGIEKIWPTEEINQTLQIIYKTSETYIF